MLWAILWLALCMIGCTRKACSLVQVLNGFAQLACFIVNLDPFCSVVFTHQLYLWFVVSASVYSSSALLLLLSHKLRPAIVLDLLTISFPQSSSIFPVVLHQFLVASWCPWLFVSLMMASKKLYQLLISKRWMALKCPHRLRLDVSLPWEEIGVTPVQW